MAMLKRVNIQVTIYITGKTFVLVGIFKSLYKYSCGPIKGLFELGAGRIYFLAAAFFLGAALAFLAGLLAGLGFFSAAGFLAAGFLAAGFLAAGFLAAFLAGLFAAFLGDLAFLAAGFLAAFLGDLAFLAAGFLAAAGFFAASLSLNDPDAPFPLV